jgi:hypothetical protein
VQYNTVQYSTVQYSTIRYSTVRFILYSLVRSKLFLLRCKTGNSSFAFNMRDVVCRVSYVVCRIESVGAASGGRGVEGRGGCSTELILLFIRLPPYQHETLDLNSCEIPSIIPFFIFHFSYLFSSFFELKKWQYKCINTQFNFLWCNFMPVRELKKLNQVSMCYKTNSQY